MSTDGLTAWIADTSNRRVSVWSRPNVTSTVWANQTIFGSQGSGPSNFERPGITTSADGLTVLVTDEDLFRVSVWGMTCPA